MRVLPCPICCGKLKVLTANRANDLVVSFFLVAPTRCVPRCIVMHPTAPNELVIDLYLASPQCQSSWARKNRTASESTPTWGL